MEHEIINSSTAADGKRSTCADAGESTTSRQTLDFSKVLENDLLERVFRPGQYLGNEWGALKKPFDEARVRLALTFPDVYELGLSNFGLKILYQIGNAVEGFLVDRAYAPGSDMELLLRERSIPLWGWESRRPLNHFELVGFSLQYELTYTNVLNLLDLSQIPVKSHERKSLFPLIFGGGPSAVNPEPMALFMDFFIIGDGEEAIVSVMRIVDEFKSSIADGAFDSVDETETTRNRLLYRLATEVPGVYVPKFYAPKEGSLQPKPMTAEEIFGVTHADPSHVVPALPERVLRQVVSLSESNQPTNNIVPYLNLVHDREVLEVRRGCDRGCRFCQPGYTFLPVRERSSDDLVKLSNAALQHSGHEEYSLLSLCVSDYTSLHDSVRALNREHSEKRSSLSFPSQRADRMNLDLAEELKVVRKSGITLAPEAGTDRMRMVINKGLSHQQIISAIEAAYKSGWTSVKLYFMCCLPTETDEDLAGIIEILKEATHHCRVIRKADPAKYSKFIEFTCTISNTVPKPFTPFQWFGQVDPRETMRRQHVLRGKLRESKLNNVVLHFTEPKISMLEAVISRGDRRISELIYRTWKAGAKFDAWDEHFKYDLWNQSAIELGISLEAEACTHREVGSHQPWDVVHVGLMDWWLVKEWEKAMAVQETAPCSENLCHACGICTELDTTHVLAAPRPEVLKRNPFVKELSANSDEDHHPSLFFTKPPEPPSADTRLKILFEFRKVGALRFISHLDLQHLLARAIRRTGMKLSYSQGFNPSPRLQLAVSLPLFQESAGEVGEVEMSEAISAEEFVARLNEQLPVEVQINRARVVERNKQALNHLVSSATYEARLPEGTENRQELIAQLPKRVQEILNRKQVLIESGRGGQTVNSIASTDGSPAEPNASQQEGLSTAHGGGKDNGASQKVRDIRPGIMSVSISEEDHEVLQFELITSPQFHVKPTELLEQIHPGVTFRVTRLELRTQTGEKLFDAGRAHIVTSDADVKVQREPILN